MGGSWSPARLQSEGPHGSLPPLSLFPSLQWGPVLNPCLAPSWHVPRWSESAKTPGDPEAAPDGPRHPVPPDGSAFPAFLACPGALREVVALLERATRVQHKITDHSCSQEQMKHYPQFTEEGPALARAAKRGTARGLSPSWAASINRCCSSSGACVAEGHCTALSRGTQTTSAAICPKTLGAAYGGGAVSPCHPSPARHGGRAGAPSAIRLLPPPHCPYRIPPSSAWPLATPGTHGDTEATLCLPSLLRRKPRAAREDVSRHPP